MVRDQDTGDLRPYDPDKDFDLPLQDLGPLPPSLEGPAPRPLDPMKDIR